MTRYPAMSSGWVVCGIGVHPAPAVRLLCLPFAGSGAWPYRQWSLPDELAAEVWAARPAGRESRHREPPQRRLEPLLEDLLRHMTPLLDQPYAMFGHSMGALLAFELTRLLRERRLPDPMHLFLSGFRAPDLRPRRTPMSGLAEGPFLDRLLEMAGPSRTAIRDPDLLRRAIPITRIDMELCEQYRFRPGRPLSVPVTCFAAVDDSEVETSDVAAWHGHTNRPGRMVTYRGGHLFPLDHAAAIRTEIARELVRGGPGRPNFTKPLPVR